MRHVITVAISVDGDTPEEAESGLEKALDNLIGDAINSYETLESREVEED